MTITPVRDERGEITNFIAIKHDVTDRKQVEKVMREQAAAIAAEQATKEGEHRFHAIFDEAAVGILLSDAQGRAVDVNPALQKMVGYTCEEIGDPGLPGIMAPEDREEHAETFNRMVRGESDQCQCAPRLVGKDGEIVWTRATCSLMQAGPDHPPMVISMIEDITEQRQLQEQLAQSQKMEAIGTLAGGVAHDFNNLLTAIGGYARLGVAATTPQDSVQHYFGEIVNASERAAGLTRQLLAFSRRQVIKPVVLNLSDLVLEMDKMARCLIGEDIELITLPAPDLASVTADPGRLEQVLVNLIVNSRDAMPNGGKIVIETSNEELSADDLRQYPESSPGPYLALTVSDNGAGMSEKVKDRIFEPFFTTKEVGKGTGLGLSTCYGIIAQSEGHIRVESEVGIGTTFTVYLPTAQAPAHRRQQASRGDIGPVGEETVLVVEDEPMVRDVAMSSLAQQGYKLLEAANGVDALRIAADYADGEIDVMITDIVMPLMGGKELAGRIAERHPNIKIVFASGYSDDESMPREVDGRDNAFLRKPFRPGELARMVRSVLDD